MKQVMLVVLVALMVAGCDQKQLPVEETITNTTRESKAIPEIIPTPVASESATPQETKTVENNSAEATYSATSGAKPKSSPVPENTQASSSTKPK